MNKFFHIIGAFAMAAVIVLSGCTDAMVGPQGDDDAEHRIVEADDGAVLQHTDPFHTMAGTDVQGRVSHRWSEPFPTPDTTQAPPDGPGGFVPPGRVGQRYGDWFPFPDSAVVLGGGNPPPNSRIGRRYSPFQLPPDSTNNAAQGGNGGGNGS